MKWHKGPPPHVGWWSVNVDGLSKPGDFWSWWNGKFWSSITHKTFPQESAAVQAGYGSCIQQDKFIWCDYYPENARVPRINPNESEF